MNDGLLRRFAAVAALCVAGLASAQDGPQKLEAIRLTAGIHVIHAELATTPQQREIGLMMRPEMAANDGMLFVFEQPGQQCFWMKNTLIPLDMVFIAPDGRVLRIESNAEPLSTTVIPSEGDISAVLELKGGEADKIGLRRGDKVIYPGLANGR